MTKVELSNLHILEANEKAFQERYGRSLEEEWMCLTNDEKFEGYERALEIINAKNTINIKEDTILVVSIGFLGMNETKKLFSKKDDHLRYVIYEPEKSVFLSRCCLDDISEGIYDKRFIFLIGDNEDEWEKCLGKEIRDSTFRHIQYFWVNGYQEFVEKAKNFSDLLEKKLYKRYTFANNVRAFRQYPYTNQIYAIANLSDNYNVEWFFEAIEDKSIPVIIVAAGPSLDKNISLLKGLYGKALIVVVSHALRKILNEGISPDLAAVTDAMPGNTFFDTLSDESFYVMATVAASLDVQKKCNGRLLYHSFDVGVVPVGLTGIHETWYYVNSGSVATDAFLLFVSAGFREFILVGQDLAYGNNGVTHVDGEKERPGLNDRQQSMIPGIDGNDVLSRPDWIIFRDTYEKTIEDTPGLHVIDATEGGALIRGTEILPLKKVIDERLTKTYPVDEWKKAFENYEKVNRENTREWLRLTGDKCGKLNDALKKAAETNEHIQAEWKAGRISGEYSASLCADYDGLYHEIMDEEDNEYFRRYCACEIQLYNEQALTCEKDEDIFRKLDIEKELFRSMLDKCMELQEYIKTFCE